MASGATVQKTRRNIRPACGETASALSSATGQSGGREDAIAFILAPSQFGGTILCCRGSRTQGACASGRRVYERSDAAVICAMSSSFGGGEGSVPKASRNMVWQKGQAVPTTAAPVAA